MLLNWGSPHPGIPQGRHTFVPFTHPRVGIQNHTLPPRKGESIPDPCPQVPGFPVVQLSLYLQEPDTSLEDVHIHTNPFLC